MLFKQAKTREVHQESMYDKVDQSLTPSPKKKHSGEPYL